MLLKLIFNPQTLTILLALIVANCARAETDQAFSSYKATYEVSAGFMTVGEAGFTFTTGNENTYKYTSFIEPRGIAKWLIDDEYEESSEGTIANNQVSPSRYFYERRGGKRDKLTTLEFDRINNIVTNTASKSNWQSAVSPLIQDRFSIQLQITQDLWLSKTTLSYLVAESKRIKEYTFEIEGYETVKTPAGKFKAIKIRQQRDSDKRETLYWLAPKLGYALVKMSYQEKGDPTVTSLLKSITNQPLPKQSDSHGAQLWKTIKTAK